ncbi:MAG: HAD hydrolase-like protein [Ruminococcus bromii]|nr:HAD hydrolase-like protein [Ruminococcus bromii]
MNTWILFDLDGTLTDSGEGVMKSVRFALDRMGFPDEPYSALRRFIGPPLHKSFMDFYGFPEEKAFEAVETMRVRYREKGVYENSLYPGMKEMLFHLKDAGAKLCVATSKPAYFTEIILKQHGIFDLFTHVVGANLDGTLTDKTEVIREVLRRIGDTSGERIFMIGDRKFDMIGAKNCGIPGVGVYFGYAEPGELEQADAAYVVQTVAELEALLLGLLRAET